MITDPGSGVPSPEAVRLAAEATVRVHDDRARCQQCPDGDPVRCPQLAWAKTILANR